MSTYDKSVSLRRFPTGNREARFGLMADAAENPLSFNAATAVELRFAKLGLVNLYSHTWSAYLPHIMIFDSAQTSWQ